MYKLIAISPAELNRFNALFENVRPFSQNEIISADEIMRVGLFGEEYITDLVDIFNKTYQVKMMIRLERVEN